MHNRSMWWIFLLLFGLTIGGIQSLGWWTRQAAAQTQAVPAPSAAQAQPKAKLTCEPKHWRALIMHR